MFCLPTHHEHHHQPRRILHGFRSHRSLRAEAAVGSPTMPISHHRKPSDVSSMARSSTESVRSPTGRSESSVEWDPLRLHPPMAPGPGPILPTRDESRRYQPHELRQARSMHFHNHHAQAQASTRALHSHSQSAPALVIYGGFDFGFSSDHRHRHDHGHHHDEDDKTPSSPSTASTGSLSEATTPDSCRGAFEWGDLDAVTPRPHAGGRGRRGAAGADHFIKRGEWKRRGIVFASDAPAASEEECFDLEMDF